MSYLNNSSITVDAILTKKGRELLAQGRNAFNITKFALADDEIDYDLWNPSHPGGTDYYGATIENLPILQAVPDETQALKYKLITMPPGTTHIPYIEPSSVYDGLIDLKTNDPLGKEVKPTTTHLNTSGQTLPPPNSSYTYHILDNTYATFEGFTNVLPGRSITNSSVPAQNGVRVIPTGTQLPTGTSTTTKLIITGDQTGARFVATIKITQRTV